MMAHSISSTSGLLSLDGIREGLLNESMKNFTREKGQSMIYGDREYHLSYFENGDVEIIRVFHDKDAWPIIGKFKVKKLKLTPQQK
jgi:hypothetical protein